MLTSKLAAGLVIIFIVTGSIGFELHFAVEKYLDMVFGRGLSILFGLFAFISTLSFINRFFLTEAIIQADRLFVSEVLAAKKGGLGKETFDFNFLLSKGSNYFGRLYGTFLESIIPICVLSVIALLTVYWVQRYAFFALLFIIAAFLYFYFNRKNISSINQDLSFVAKKVITERVKYKNTDKKNCELNRKDERHYYMLYAKRLNSSSYAMSIIPLISSVFLLLLMVMFSDLGVYLLDFDDSMLLTILMLLKLTFDYFSSFVSKLTNCWMFFYPIKEFVVWRWMKL